MKACGKHENVIVVYEECTSTKYVNCPLCEALEQLENMTSEAKSQEQEIDRLCDKIFEMQQDKKSEEDHADMQETERRLTRDMKEDWRGTA